MIVKVINHPKFIQNECTTTFIDESPELFEFNSAQDKTTRLLTFLSDVLINGSILKDERLYPDPSVKPIIPQLGTSMPPPDGWRNVLLEKGPQAFAQAVRAHKSALITDTTWRDAHQSLLATRVRTVDLLNIAPATARTLSKCFSLEMWGGATFDVCLRFLHECPWERLIRLRAEVPNIPFQMLLRGANAVGYALPLTCPALSPTDKLCSPDTRRTRIMWSTISSRPPKSAEWIFFAFLTH